MQEAEIISYAETIVSTIAHFGLLRAHARDDVHAVLLGSGLTVTQADRVIACALDRGLLVEEQKYARRFLRTSRRIRVSAISALVGVKINAVLESLAPEAGASPRAVETRASQ